MNNLKECKHRTHSGERLISIDNFGMDRQKRDNLKPYCKDCCSQQGKNYYKNNKDKILQSSAKYYLDNQENEKVRRTNHYQSNSAYFKQYREVNRSKNKKYQKEYREEHVEERRAYNKQYYKNYYANNKAKYVHYVAVRKARKLRATPDWCDLDCVKTFYQECANITQKTGIKHHVDHIIPLQGKNVCGLHCPANLQIITEVENLKKGNKLINTLTNWSKG